MHFITYFEKIVNGEVNAILSLIKNIMYSAPVMAAISVFSVYFTLKCRFFTPRAIKKTCRDLKASLSDKGAGISPLSAVAIALGGTVGIGSITGVGWGIATGGIGSVFWMWVCSFFGAGLKYAEIKIALNTPGSRGGAPFRLKALGCPGLAALFCLFCVAASFGTGNLTQVGAMALFFEDLGMPRLLGAVICTVIIALAVFGGRRGIARLNGIIVPAASVFYIILCLAILLPCYGQIPGAFLSIFKSALGVKAAAGGFSGAVLAAAVREGFARSIFSGEAGMGSSPLAHGSTGSQSPGVQAEWGLFEIFFDTFAVSTLTALCLICTQSSDAFLMFRRAFGTFGFWCFGGLCAVFAFASVISWCYYAQCCLDFYYEKSKIPGAVYRVFFALAAFFGVFAPKGALWELADILNILMMLPNLFLLFKCRKEIERIC